MNVHLVAQVASFGRIPHHFLAVDQFLEPLVGLHLLISILRIWRDDLHLSFVALLGQRIRLINFALGHFGHLIKIVIDHILDLRPFPRRLLVDELEVLSVGPLGLVLDGQLFHHIPHLLLIFDALVPELVEGFKLTRKVQPTLVVENRVFDLSYTFLEA